MGSNGSTTRVREPWWFWTWTIWGAVCGALIGAADQSPVSGLAWAGAAALVGLIGEPCFRWICTPFFAIAKNQLTRRVTGMTQRSGTPASQLQVISQATVDIIDPNSKPWALLPGMVVMMALLFGIFGGGVVGAILTWTPSWQGTSLGGALWGVALGPVVMCPLAATVMSMTLLSMNGPRIDAVRTIVDEACREAERRGHEHLVPGHLLMAVFHAAAPRVIGLASCSVELLQDACDELDAQLATRSSPLDDESALLKSGQINDAIQTAIDEAKALKQPRVEAGHLLLGLLWTWPSGTTRALAQLGIDPVEPREDLRNRLRRAA